MDERWWKVRQALRSEATTLDAALVSVEITRREGGPGRRAVAEARHFLRGARNSGARAFTEVGRVPAAYPRLTRLSRVPLSARLIYAAIKRFQGFHI